MFGLNEIAWGTFIKLICLSLMGWYALVFILFWLKQKSRKQNLYYEDYRSGNAQPEHLQAISVSSKEFPSEIINAFPENQILLEASFYEETGLDEGFGIEHFLQKDDPRLSKLKDENQIHFQQ